MFGTGRNINICAHNGRQGTISATTFSRCTLKSHLRVSAPRRAMAPERSPHHHPVPMWVRTARQCERRIGWTRRAKISGAICGPKFPLILLHMSDGSDANLEGVGDPKSKWPLLGYGRRTPQHKFLFAFGRTTARLRSCGAPRLFACSTDKCTTTKSRPRCQSKKKKDPSRDGVAHVRACALARAGKGGDGRGRRRRRRLRHNVFSMVPRTAGSALATQSQITGPCVMTFCLKVWSKTSRPLLGNSTLCSLHSR